VIHARGFFALQLRFARTVAGLSQQPLDRVLLDYTNLYIRFGLGRAFDPSHPDWTAYLAGLRDSDDPVEWTYRFSVTRPPVAPPALVGTFGCFSYGRLSDDRIRLHFHNSEVDGHSPLGIERVEQRRVDLRALFAHVKRTGQPPLRVVGASWLYNLEAYRRLFPKPYLATARVLHHRFRHMPLWGQFVNRHGEINEALARDFLDRLGRQRGLEDLEQCFPFQVLGVEAHVDEFYAFLDV
jgi:hypothetical protein